MTLVIAHRGASGQRPENTLPAYALAVEQGADMIEIDLHRTRDGAVVVTHDEDLSGLGGKGEIADATLAEIRALDAGEGCSVPLLDEVLAAYGSLVRFNLELKRGKRSEYPELERIVVGAMAELGLLSRTLFSSFFDPVLARLRDCGEEVRIGVLVSPRAASGWLERARAVGACAINLHVRLARRERVARAQAEGLAVNVYTVDDEPTLRRLLDLGVDGIFTNHPARLRQLVDARA